MKNLVRITKEEFDIILDIRYATTNNVCEKVLYKDATCYLHKEAAERLKLAAIEAKKMGLKLKIFDGFRPMSVQEYFFNHFADDPSKAGFFSDPKNGAAPHCRGVAVDLTLTDLEGKELDMGSDFDELSDLAFHGCEKVSANVARNRAMLLGLMTQVGFDFYSKEWWHYQLFRPREYEIVDVVV